MQVSGKEHTMAFLVKDLVDRQIFGGVRLVAGVFKCFKPYFMGQCNGNTGHSQIFK